MVARPAAVPRAKEARAPKPRAEEERPAAPAATNDSGVPSALAETKPSPDDLPALDFVDFVFSESSPDFQIEAEVDPIDAEAQEAAILFANGQDAAARTTLENAVLAHRFGPGERLWMMLFDLYRVTGQKAAFEALEIEFAQAFEKSPPGWRDTSNAKATPGEAAVGSLLFKGELTGDNAAAYTTIRQALAKNPRLRLDLSKISQLDAGGCGHLLTLLQQALKARREIELIGRDTLGSLIEQRIESGRPEDKECWLLLLELLQLQGQHDAFEELAINYAVTFEVSPPSWEAHRIAAPEPVEPVVIADSAEPPADGYVVQGDIKASRFPDLAAHAGLHDPVLIECSALRRMDFISAGALLNILTTVRGTGKQIVFRHPNHLVAELFGVVGLKAVAAIVYAYH